MWKRGKVWPGWTGSDLLGPGGPFRRAAAAIGERADDRRAVPTSPIFDLQPH